MSNESTKPEDRKRLILAAIATTILVCLPFSSFHQGNYADSSFIPGDFYPFWLKTAAMVLVAIAVVAVGLSFLVRRDSRARFVARFAVAAGVSFFLLFLFDGFASLLSIATPGMGTVAVFLVLVAIAFALVFYLAGRSEFIAGATIFAAVPFVVAVPSMAGTIMSILPGGSASVEVAGDGQTEGGERPNVYYFITDAFTSAAVLKDNIGLDISDFIEQMEGMGFYHAADAHSAFNLTSLTLSSIFMAKYEITEDFPSIDNRLGNNLYPRLLRGNKVPDTIARAKRLGYDFYIVGNKWGRCGGDFVSCYAEEAGTEDVSYLTQTFWSATPMAIAYAQHRAEDGEDGAKTPDRPDVDALAKVLAHLERNGAPDAPRFTFVHSLPPHPPYLYLSDCSDRAVYDVDFGAWSEKAKPLYADNVVCTISKILRVTKTILASDPSAIIVFQGDHGSAFNVRFSTAMSRWPEAAFRERSSILNLVRLPERCRSFVTSRSNNVTTVNAVLACIEGGEPQAAEDRSYVGTYSDKSPDKGLVRRIDPLSNRLYDEAQADRTPLTEAAATEAYEKNKARYVPLLDEFRAARVELKKAQATLDGEELDKAQLEYKVIRARFEEARDAYRASRQRLLDIKARRRAREANTGQ